MLEKPNEHAITFQMARHRLYLSLGFAPSLVYTHLHHLVGLGLVRTDTHYYTPIHPPSLKTPKVYSDVFYALFPDFLAAITPPPHTWADFAVAPDGTLQVVPKKSFDETTVPIIFPEGSTDMEYYWMQRGECPVCRDGTAPVVMPGGWFECKQCKWRNS